jgi:hypothetical protein
MMVGFDQDTYLILLVYSPHSVVTLILGYDLSSIFNNNLVWLESAVGADPIATIHGLDDFDSNVVLPASLASLPKVFETSISAMLCADIAIGYVTLVKHEPVETTLIAP